MGRQGGREQGSCRQSVLEGTLSFLHLHKGALLALLVTLKVIDRKQMLTPLAFLNVTFDINREKYRNTEYRYIDTDKPTIQNIATGETSQAITPFHFLDNFNFHH